jgi:hypothetical protein
MARKWIAGLVAGVVAPARPRTRATVGVLAVATCGLMSLGMAASAQSAPDRVFAALGQTSITGPVSDAVGGGGTGELGSLSGLGGAAEASAGLGSSPDCVGGDGEGEL